MCIRDSYTGAHTSAYTRTHTSSYTRAYTRAHIPAVLRALADHAFSPRYPHPVLRRR